MKRYLPKEVEAALDGTGLPWSIDPGKRHWQIRVAGRLAGILPHGFASTKNPRTIANTVCQIRRKARELRGEE